MALEKKNKKSPCKCLLVDDLDKNLVALEALLKNEEVEIYKARSGTDALELLLDHEFAVALIDVQMPLMSGFELAEIMRSTEMTKSIPIIFITAGSWDSARVFQGYESGAVDFLFKPLDPHIVRNKVRIFIELFQQKNLLKEKLDQLREAQELQTRILESSQDCIKLLDLEGNLLSISPGGQKALDICNVTEYLNRPWIEFWEGAERQKAQEALQEAKEGGTGKFTGKWVSAQGIEKWWDEVITPVLGTENIPIRLLAISRDITDLKRAENELREALKVRDEFLSIASHELKTPLTSLKLQHEMILRILSKHGIREQMSEKTGRMLNSSNRQIDHLSNLVSDLLDVSRITAKKINYKFIEVNLSQVLRNVVDQYEEQLLQAKCQLKEEYEEELIGYWDPNRLEQIVVNLLSNACKYAPGSEIKLKTAKVGSTARIIVEDKGVGIAPEKIPYIFERFERATSSTSVSGLGLGLYIAQEVAKAHGGEIRVKSTLGQGTTFIVDLPFQGPQAHSSLGLVSSGGK